MNIRKRQELAASSTQSKVGFPSVSRGTNKATVVDREQKNDAFFYGLSFFADDNSVWGTGFDESTVAVFAQRCGNEIAKTAQQLRIDVSHKSAATIFLRKDAFRFEDKQHASSALPKIELSPSLQIPIVVRRMTKEIEQSEQAVMQASRCLGLFMDSSLTFAYHISQACSKALTAISAIRSMWPILTPHEARLLYLGTAFQILAYASEIVCPATNDTSFCKLEAAHNAGARAITGCACSSPTVSVLPEAGLRSFRTMIRIHAESRIEKLLRYPDSSPTRRRFELKPANDSKSAVSIGTLRDWRDERASGSAPVDGSQREPRPCFDPALRIDPADTQFAHCVRFYRRFGVSKRQLKEDDHDLAESEMRRLNTERYKSLPFPRIEVWCDGSLTMDKDNLSPANEGFAYIVEKVESAEGARTELARSKDKVNLWACNYTEESHAMRDGAKRVVELLSADPASSDLLRLPVVFFTDCLSFLDCMERGPLNQVDLIPTETWRSCLHMLNTGLTASVSFCFVFSHCGFELHERVDKLAKEAAAEARIPYFPRPAHWNDAARQSRLKHARDHDDFILHGESSNNFRGRHLPRDENGVVKRSYACSTQLLQLPMEEAKLIYRLRVGVDPALPGCRYRIQELCPRCFETLSREGYNGVEHMFSCSSFEAGFYRNQVFARYDIKPTVLWSSEAATLRDVLRYRELFIEKVLGTVEEDEERDNTADGAEEEEELPL